MPPLYRHLLLIPRRLQPHRRPTRASLLSLNSSQTRLRSRSRGSSARPYQDCPAFCAACQHIPAPGVSRAYALPWKLPTPPFLRAFPARILRTVYSGRSYFLRDDKPFPWWYHPGLPIGSALGCSNECGPHSGHAVLNGSPCDVIMDTDADPRLQALAPVGYSDLRLGVQEQLSSGLTAVHWPPERAHALEPAEVHFARLAPRAPTSSDAEASAPTLSATAASAPAPAGEPPSSTASPSAAYTKVSGSCLPTRPSPNSCLTTAELAEPQTLLETFRVQSNDGSEPQRATAPSCAP
ncbi:hypothetical protein Efla_003195 [Eimeria flavescens]